MDLIGGTAEDDDAAGETLAKPRQSEGRGGDAAGDRPMTAGMHRLDLAIGAHGRNGIVEHDHADGPAGPRPGQGRAKRRCHAADAALDLKAAAGKRGGDMGR